MSVETRRLGFAESDRLIQIAADGSTVAPEQNPFSAAYKPGDLIAGKYRLERLIGRGGMGVVWEAYSSALDIRVAIKLIHQFTSSDEEQQRLLLEARAAARLVDPGVVRVFDCGKTNNGEPYVVMELLEGEDLATRLDERGRIPPIETIRTLLPIVRALGTAHAEKIVHRDVKPENVFFTKSVTGEEQPKLLDFGIAKVDVSWDKRLTQAGSTLGSPNYMSPEQAKGDDVDGRSDIWGISVVIYEAITGQLPFDGSSYNAVMHAILSAPVQSFTELGVNEPELWQIVARGLDRDRSTRWQSSEELAEALGAWLIARGVQHDVTGVSLHATKKKRRSSHVRTLASERPPKLALVDSKSVGAALAQTLGKITVHPTGFWMRRPSWFVPALGVFTVLLAGIMVWRLTRPAPFLSTLAVPASVNEAAVPARTAADPTAVRPVEAPRAPSPAAMAASADPNALVQSKKAVPPLRSNKPATKPGNNAALAAPKNEPFKSPFD